jgi:hypothetical protein
MLNAKRFITSAIVWGALLLFFYYSPHFDLGTSAILSLSMLYLLDKSLESRIVEGGLKMPKFLKDAQPTEKKSAAEKPLVNEV